MMAVAVASQFLPDQDSKSYNQSVRKVYQPYHAFTFVSEKPDCWCCCSHGLKFGTQHAFVSSQQQPAAPRSQITNATYYS
mgnify:CR=1 FL=1|jgi:hypothetical protein